MARKEVKKAKKQGKEKELKEKKKIVIETNEDEEDFDIKQFEKVAQGKIVKKKKDKKKKKQKQTSVPVEMSHIHESAGQNRALVYLRTWANDRANWKFEKCRQIWLLQNLYEDKINDADFKLLASYTCSIQGHMRESAFESAKTICDLEERWKSLLDEGLADADVILQLKTLRPNEKKVTRATEIVRLLK